MFSFHPKEGMCSDALPVSWQVSCPQDSPEQLDCRFFGELLAELHRKSNDLYSCLLQHVEKIGTRYCHWICHCHVPDTSTAQLTGTVFVNWLFLPDSWNCLDVLQIHLICK